MDESAVARGTAGRHRSESELQFSPLCTASVARNPVLDRTVRFFGTRLTVSLKTGLVKSGIFSSIHFTSPTSGQNAQNRFRLWPGLCGEPRWSSTTLHQDP